MARSPITVLIIICFLVLLFAYPTFAQVPEWRTSLSDDTISSIALSSNGDYVVIGSTKGEVHLFTRKGTEVWAEEFTGEQYVKIADDGSRIFSGSQESLYSDKGSIRIINENGTTLSKTPTGWITALALARNSSQLAVGTTGGETFIFNRDGTKNRLSNDPMLVYLPPIASVAISDDGSTSVYSVFFDKDPNLVINRKNSNKKLSTLNVITSIAISSNGTDIATSEGEGSRGFVSLRYNNGTTRWTTKTPRVSDLKISDNGSLVVAGGVGGSVFLLNRTGDIVWDFPTDGGVPGLSIDSQAMKIVTETTNGTLYLLDNKGSLLWKYHDDGVMNKKVTAVEISRDGSSIIAALNNRELLYFTTSKILPVPQLPSSNETHLVKSSAVNVPVPSTQNNTSIIRTPFNFSLNRTANSKLFTVNGEEIVGNKKSGVRLFNYRGVNNSWIPLDPILFLNSGKNFTITWNLSGIQVTSINTTVKPTPISIKNTTVNQTTSNNTTVKPTPISIKNATVNQTISNNTTVKTTPTLIKNATVNQTISNNTTVKTTPTPIKNATVNQTISNNTTVKPTPTPIKNATGTPVTYNDTTDKTKLNKSIGSALVNTGEINPLNNKTIIRNPLKYSLIPAGNSKLFPAIGEIFQDLNSEKWLFNYRAINSSWIAMDPTVFLYPGKTFQIIRNVSRIQGTSNNTKVKSSLTPTQNAIGIQSTTNNTTIKPSPTSTKNGTSFQGISNNTTDKSNLTLSRNSTFPMKSPYK